ncbi:hypothetical protein BDR06DRAFT_972646 [Suillus hirtellus]|nr:hypothetical protein BDR06DRAFT_972646 [Suillus hirtellus]
MEHLGIETADTGSRVRGSSAIEVGEGDGSAIACEGLLTKSLSLGRADRTWISSPSQWQNQDNHRAYECTRIHPAWTWILLPSRRPAHPPLRYRHLYVAKAEREQWKALFEAGDSKKRKVDDEDTNGADLMKKKRRLNQNVNNRPTGIIDVKPKTLPTITTDKVVLPGDEKAFWDAGTRPAEWGSDAHIATPCQCNKCTKLDILCIVLLDKKFGYIQLACANCDQMKITCAIDSVGVRQRMQAMAATAIVEAGVPMCTLPTIGTSPWPEQDDQPAPVNIADHEPTARDILQGIQDLSKRLDLFATNDHVDALGIRVCSVENILHQQLYALEQRLNASDAW